MLSSIELTMFNARIAELQEALVGAGEDGDLSTSIKGEGRLLAWEISTELGPRKKENGEHKVYLDAKKTFFPEPTKTFPENKRNGKGGDSGLSWLYAGPDFIVGVPQENFQMGISESAMRDQHKSLAEKVSGKAWSKIGKRGKQSVMKLNRIIVKREAFNRFIKSKQTRVGRMRATFAYAAYMLGQTRIPAWVSRHFDKVSADGRAIYDQSKLNDKVSPSLTFGSGAPGIENFEPMIESAVETRLHKLTAKIQDIIHGYSKDWMAGRKITKKAKRE
jgi:hypothetical protein